MNQLDYIYPLLKNPEWVIELASWQETLAQVQPEDFVYADPPYFGRHTDYYSSWTEADAKALLRRLQELPAGFALSTWKGNKYRQNPVVEHGVAGAVIRTTTHFYHVGPTEDLRNEIEEALVIRDGFAAGD